MPRRIPIVIHNFDAVFIAAFKRKAPRRGDDECWPWLGRCGPAGYGVIDGIKGAKALLAHRVAHALAHDGIRPGMDILHGCDNPSCTNPRHLREGTPAENATDRIRRGDSPHAKLFKAAYAKAHPTDKRDQRVQDEVAKFCAGEPPTERAVAAVMGITVQSLRRLRLQARKASGR